MGVRGGGSPGGFFLVNHKEVDLTICGTPARSSKTSKPRASKAKAAIVGNNAGLAGELSISPNMPIIPNSCTPIPAGVIGTKASAVTNG